MGKNESYTPGDHPLTMQALNNGTTITFDNKATGPVEYSINNGSWETLAAAGASGTTSSLNAGDKVYLRGSNATYENSSSEDSKISCSGPCYVYGNFMSLVSVSSFASATTLTSGSTFCNLFKENTNIRNHPYKDMVLPATKLTEFCYYGMFWECTGLSRSPIMADASASLEEKCYNVMFYNCRGLYYVTCYSSPAVFDYYTQWLDYVQSKGTLVIKSEYKEYWNYHTPDGWTVTQ